MTTDKMTRSLVDIFQEIRECFSRSANGAAASVFLTSKHLTTGWSWVECMEIWTLLTKEVCTVVNFSPVAVSLTASNFLAVKHIFNPLFFTRKHTHTHTRLKWFMKFVVLGFSTAIVRQ